MIHRCVDMNLQGVLKVFVKAKSAVLPELPSVIEEDESKSVQIWAPIKTGKVANGPLVWPDTE